MPFKFDSSKFQCQVCCFCVFRLYSDWTSVVDALKGLLESCGIINCSALASGSGVEWRIGDTPGPLQRVFQSASLHSTPTHKANSEPPFLGAGGPSGCLSKRPLETIASCEQLQFDSVNLPPFAPFPAKLRTRSDSGDGSPPFPSSQTSLPNDFRPTSLSSALFHEPLTPYAFMASPATAKEGKANNVFRRVFGKTAATISATTNKFTHIGVSKAKTSLIKTPAASEPSLSPLTLAVPDSQTPRPAGQWPGTVVWRHGERPRLPQRRALPVGRTVSYMGTCASGRAQCSIETLSSHSSRSETTADDEGIYDSASLRYSPANREICLMSTGRAQRQLSSPSGVLNIAVTCTRSVATSVSDYSPRAETNSAIFASNATSSVAADFGSLSISHNTTPSREQRDSISSATVSLARAASNLSASSEASTTSAASSVGWDAQPAANAAVLQQHLFLPSMRNPATRSRSAQRSSEPIVPHRVPSASSLLPIGLDGRCNSNAATPSLEVVQPSSCSARISPKRHSSSCTAKEALAAAAQRSRYGTIDELVALPPDGLLPLVASAHDVPGTTRIGGDATRLAVLSHLLCSLIACVTYEYNL